MSKVFSVQILESVHSAEFIQSVAKEDLIVTVRPVKTGQKSLMMTIAIKWKELILLIGFCGFTGFFFRCIAYTLRN